MSDKHIALLSYYIGWQMLHKIIKDGEATWGAHVIADLKRRVIYVKIPRNKPHGSCHRAPSIK